MAKRSSSSARHGSLNTSLIVKHRIEDLSNHRFRYLRFPSCKIATIATYSLLVLDDTFVKEDHPAEEDDIPRLSRVA